MRPYNFLWSIMPSFVSQYYLHNPSPALPMGLLRTSQYEQILRATFQALFFLRVILSSTICPILPLPVRIVYALGLMLPWYPRICLDHHPGNFLQLSAKLDPWFPGPHAFPLLSLYLCTGGNHIFQQRPQEKSTRQKNVVKTWHVWEYFYSTFIFDCSLNIDFQIGYSFLLEF